MSTTTVNMSISRRDAVGKGVARKLRKNKQIPAIVYGFQLENAIPVTVEPKPLLQALYSPHGRNSVFKLDMGKGQSVDAVVKDLQQDILSQELLHVDFISIDLTKPIQVNVPFSFTGKSPGVVLDGGILEYKRYSLEVECKPDSIPLNIEVDLGELNIGDVIHVSDIKLPDGISTETAGSLTIVICSARAEEEEEEVKPAEGEEALAADAEGAEGAAPGDAAAADKAGPDADKGGKDS